MRSAAIAVAVLVVVAAPSAGCSTRERKPKREVSDWGPQPPPSGGLATAAAGVAAEIGACRNGCQAIAACGVVDASECIRLCGPDVGGLDLERFEGVGCGELAERLIETDLGTCRGSCAQLAGCDITTFSSCTERCARTGHGPLDLAKSRLATCQQLRQQAGLPPAQDELPPLPEALLAE